MRALFIMLFCCLLLQSTTLERAQAQQVRKKILVVVTSNSKLKNGQGAGYYLPELVDFFQVIRDNGLDTADFDVVSPKGGRAPMYRRQTYINYYSGFALLPSILAKVDSSKKPQSIVAQDYSAVYYVGGFAALFDLPNDTAIGRIAMEIYRAGGVLGAVCHGPAGLLALKQEDGTPLIKGKRVTTRSWDEETGHDQITREDVLAAFPFVLFEKMEEEGADVSFGPYMAPYVVTDERIVTGQNENSATAVAEEMMLLMNQVSNVESSNSAPKIELIRTHTGFEFFSSDGKELSIELTDMLGRVRTSHGMRVSFEGLTSGHYLARIRTSDSQSTMKVAY